MGFLCINRFETAGAGTGQNILNTSSSIPDPYNWTVTIEARTIGALAAEIMWQGIPSPAERWVRVYRAAHACGEMPGKEHDEFRLASRDQPPSVTLIGLPSDTR